MTNDIACLSVAVVEVQGVEKRESVFQVRTTDRDYEAKNVVIATGLYQSQKSRPLRQVFPRTFFSCIPCNTAILLSCPTARVLVIGTGQSGAQIAEELYQSGRKVYLSIGSAGRVPRRYRGKDISDWFHAHGNV